MKRNTDGQPFFINGQLNLLLERIRTAKVIAPPVFSDKNNTKVRFGATVTISKGKEKLKFKIVGVDEANIKEGKISFTAPLARALLGKSIKENLSFKFGNKTESLQILNIDYLK